MRRTVVTDTLFLALGQKELCVDAVHYASTCDDFETAWASCPRADWLAYMLVKLGFPVERVMSVVLDVCTEPIRARLSDGFRYRTMHNADYVKYCVKVFSKETDVPLDIVAEEFRDKFEFSEVLAAMEAAIDRNTKTALS